MKLNTKHMDGKEYVHKCFFITFLLMKFRIVKSSIVVGFIMC